MLKPPIFRIVFLVAGAFLLVTGCASKQAPKDSFEATYPPPKGVELLVQGVQAMDSGDRDRAIAILQKAIEANPNLITPRNLLGDLYREREEYSLALEQYQALVYLDEYTASNQYYLGLCYQFMDRIKEAAAAYLAALRLNPQDAKSNMNLGLVNLALGHTDQAVSHIEEATKLDPQSAAAFANLGVALDAKGEYTKAESAYRRSLELDSSQPATLLNLGTNLVLQKKAPEAIAVLEQAIKGDDSPRVHKQLGDAYSLNKRYDDAIKQYNLALEGNPRYVAAHNGLGAALIEKYITSAQKDDAWRLGALKSWHLSLNLNSNQPQVAASIRQWENLSPPVNK